MDAALSVPPIPKRVRIPKAAIQSVVDQIAAQFSPDKIILFGSYAYGHPRPESDVDLLVILDTQNSETELASRMRQSIQYRFGLDLIVCTPQRLAQRLAWGDSFLKEIVQRGTVLYESPDA